MKRTCKANSLEDLYDTVLIPALNLAEEDRHRNALDDSTVEFYHQTTKDLVEEFSLREDDLRDVGIAGIVSKKIACLPVRDDADEIVGIMLAQLLDRAGYATIAIPMAVWIGCWRSC